MCHIFTYTAYTLDNIIALTAGGGKVKVTDEKV